LEPVIIEDLVKIGEDRGRTESYVRWFARGLGRSLTDCEKAILAERIETLGMDRVDEVYFNSNREALAAWLADPTAR
jgi:hypothetical protein